MRLVLRTKPVLRTKRAGRYQSRGRGAGWTVALVALVALLGSGQTAPESQPSESLKQRVTAFWEARLKGDELTAYQYEAYSHTGEMTATQYIQARSPALKYMAYTIDTIQEQENEAQVTVKLQYQMSIPGMVDLPMAMAIKERWVRFDNQWYRNLESEESGKGNRQPEKPGKGKSQQG